MTSQFLTMMSPTISDHDITWLKLYWGVVMWPKFDNSSISVKEVILTSISQGFDQKNRFFEG